jgi:deoxyribose-phosphate aldolase
MDLTNLNTTDGYDTVEEWVKKNCLDVAKDHPALKPAAICVYPLFAHIVRTELRKSGIKTAAVSTSFPTGLTFLDIKISETKEAVREGAEEIDMVVNRGVWNEGEELDVLEEVS